MDVLIFFDEIFLKGGNRPYFLRLLAKNISGLLPGVKIDRVEGGFLLRGISPDLFACLKNIPGISKFSRVYICPNTLEDIFNEISRIKFDREIKTFRITASRASKKYLFSSEELNRKVGDFVRKSRGWKVDLDNCDLDLHVDVTSTKARIFERMQNGMGGLPTGSTGKAVCLLSGGIDSPVAAYLTMKRGAEVTLVHFQNKLQVTDEVSQKIIDLGKALANFQPNVELIIFPYADIQENLIKNILADYRMIINRRIMFKIAEKIAKNKNCGALVTGDSLGQVASQTMENLECIYDASKMLKFAPLIGMNKSEITKIARAIGTFEISSRPYEDCCSLFVAKHPVTRARLSDVKNLEKKLNLKDLDKIKPISYYLSKY